jgi:hypothetical protein
MDWDIISKNTIMEIPEVIIIYTVLFIIAIIGTKNTRNFKN